MLSGPRISIASGKNIAANSSLLGMAILFGVMVATLGGKTLFVVVLSVATILFIIAGRTRLVVWVMGAGFLVAPTTWPLLASLGPIDVYVGDLLLAVATVAALIRTKTSAQSKIVFVLVLFIVFGVARSEPTGIISFLRVVEPIIAGVALGLFLPPKYDLWRDVRWMCLTIIATTPLFGSMTSRWSGLSGDANSIALIASVTVILGITQRDVVTRTLLVAVGLTGLIGARGITATIALVAGIATLSILGQKVMFLGKLRRISASLVLAFSCTAALLIPLLRVDGALTLKVHIDQASLFWNAFANVNPFVGGGWDSTDPAVFTYTILKDLHNVYLDMIIYLGVLGVTLFGMLLVLMMRGSDPVTRAVLITAVVWLNTMGAFPGVGWGIIGLTIAMAISRHHETGVSSECHTGVTTRLVRAQ